MMFKCNNKPYQPWKMKPDRSYWCTCANVCVYICMSNLDIYFAVHLLIKGNPCASLYSLHILSSEAFLLDSFSQADFLLSFCILS